ncbi:MAG: hypothetical protein V4773_24315 [Verrucomicrobiota bacterium]
MRSSIIRGGLVSVLVTGLALAADSTATKGSSSSSSKSASTKGGAAKGNLPDPAILDGSALPAEKRSEHGMIGDFELPGDDNARTGKVGGPQNPNGPGQPGGVNVNLPIPGIPIPSAGGLPGQSGGQGGLPNPLGGAQGGLPNPLGGGQQAGGIPPAGGGQSGGAPGGEQGQGNPIAGGGDANATPDGVQVGQLGGPGGQDGGPQGQQGGGRPSQVAIGDSAMRIEQPAGGTQGVVGTQLPPGPVQQHDRGTGSGGKSGGAGGNKGVERGRAMPAGL